MQLPNLVIACVSDQESFAKHVYDELLAILERQREEKEGKLLKLDKELIALDGDEITVHESAGVPREMVKWALESLVRRDPEKFKGYQVIEFGDSITIGRVLDPSKMEMATCEISGYFTPYEGELQTHRMTHFGP